MKDFLTMKALAIVLPAILGPIAYLLSRSLLNAWRWIDGLPPVAKRCVVLGLSIFLAALAQEAGVVLPGECSGLGGGDLTGGCQSALSAPVFLKGVLAAGVAFLMHALKKADPRD